LSPVVSGVGPGSPLALRPGIRCEIGPSLPGLWARSDLPAASPDKAREGRRSGAYSRGDRIKIGRSSEGLSPVVNRVGPGSPLALRPGIRCEIGRSLPDPRVCSDLPAVSPDKARKGRRSGAYSRGDGIKITSSNEGLSRGAGRVGPGSPLRCGRECAEGWGLHSRIRGHAPISRSHPRTRPVRAADPGPTRAATVSKSQVQTKACRGGGQSRSRLSACAAAGNPQRDWAFIPGSVGVLRSPSRIPGQGPKGRRSGAYSRCSGTKIGRSNEGLSRGAGRVGPGSPLALRPGIRCEIGPSLPGLWVCSDLPAVSPDKARKGR